MTKKDIAKSINKHSVLPVIALVIAVFALKVINGYFFEKDPISPMLIILLSVGASLYTFQKVLVDLLLEDGDNSSQI